jgi:glycosyltransferase involved in cell wall biosynthesis
MAKRLSVLLTTEGTYPYHSGGVSTWCDNLIKGSEWVDFTLLPIMMNPYISVKYDLPSNVIKVINVPLWGTEEPAEYILAIPFSHVYLAKQRTAARVIRDHFLPVLRQFIRELYTEPTNTQAVGELLFQMYEYFREFDYNTTLKSQLVWEAFGEEVLSHAAQRTNGQFPSLFELTEALRWLYRFLIPLNADPPRVDVVHSTAAAFCGIPCIIAKLRDGTPFLLTEHGVYIREQYLSVSRMKSSFSSKDFLLNLIVAISRTNYHFADQISPVCHYNKRWELAHGASIGKIRVIHNGVDPRLFSPRELHRSRATVVISTARIDPLKDIETLIQAASYVKRETPDVEFLVYGAITDPDYYQQCLDLRRSLGLDATVSFPGHSGTPWEVYNQGDVVALTSISEAFPYSVIEAMACGRPVVASDVGGVREALEGCGHLVRPRQPEAFASAILALLHDREARSEMGEEARDRVLNTFTLDRFIQEYGESYQGLAR